METPDYAEIFRSAVDARLAAFHVAGFGKVRSYADGKANVTPGWKRAVPTDVEGEFVVEGIPELPDVPVIHFGGAGGYFRPSLSPGDTVLVIVCDTDQATWLRTGNASDPGDLRRFHLSHACCIPWAKSPGVVADAAALADKVATELNAIAAALDTIAAAVPVTNPYTAAVNTVAAVRARIQSAVLKLGS